MLHPEAPVATGFFLMTIRLPQKRTAVKSMGSRIAVASREKNADKKRAGHEPAHSA